MTKTSPIDPFIKKHGMLILDGGLATELEKMGFDLNGWLSIKDEFIEGM